MGKHNRNATASLHPDLWLRKLALVGIFSTTIRADPSKEFRASSSRTQRLPQDSTFAPSRERQGRQCKELQPASSSGYASLVRFWHSNSFLSSGSLVSYKMSLERGAVSHTRCPPCQYS